MSTLLSSHTRNLLCPCGSGLKTKRCCGKAQMLADAKARQEYYENLRKETLFARLEAGNTEFLEQHFKRHPEDAESFKNLLREAEAEDPIIDEAHTKDA